MADTELVLNVLKAIKRVEIGVGLSVCAHRCAMHGLAVAAVAAIGNIGPRLLASYLYV